MKKFFSYVGVISLMLLSFFYTEKTVEVVKEYDDVMIRLKEYSSKEKNEAIDAKIDGNTIIPGIKGIQVNINSSYSKMKKYGVFNSSLVEYEYVNPQITLQDNIDKYIISGNPQKRMVSLVFLIDNDSNINSIIDILDKKNIKGNFFINSDWLNNNSKNLKSIIDKGHVIGNLSNNYNYLDSSFLWMDTVIKKIGKQKNNYCYFKEENLEELNMCALYGNYSIKPINIINYPYKEVREKLSSGAILAFKINPTLIEELPIIINYINSKGLIIDNLNELIAE